MTTPSAPPGWYPSSTNPALIHYWDGSAWVGSPQPPAPGSRGTNGFAIASMVLGILWLYWVGSILALVFGYIALQQIRERQQGGRGMAIAGVVLGWIGVAVVVLLIIFGVALSSTGN